MGIFSFRTERGFTLVEIMAVVAILAILASIFMSTYNESRKKARDTQRMSDLQQIQLALRVYKDLNGAYPTEAAGISISAGELHDDVKNQFPQNIADPLYASDPSYDYVYDSDVACTGGSSNTVIYAKKMESVGQQGKWSGVGTVCAVGGDITTESSGIILK